MMIDRRRLLFASAYACAGAAAAASTGFQLRKKGSSSMQVLGFRAFLSAEQYITPPVPMNYCDVAFDSLMYDDTGWFVPGNLVGGIAGTFQPQGTGILLSMWQIWNQSNASNVQGVGVVSKLIGGHMIGGRVQDTAAIGFFGAYPNTSSSVASAIIKVQPGDVVKISDYVAPAGPGPIGIDANPAHTYWEALFFPS